MHNPTRHDKKLLGNYFKTILCLVILMFIVNSVYFKLNDDAFKFPSRARIKISDALKFIQEHYAPQATSAGNATTPLGTDNIKYILQWTAADNIPFLYMGTGRQNFINRKCRFTNCYVTSDRSFLLNITEFDAVVFAAPELVFLHESDLPETRSPRQKYVFSSIESPANYPLCSDRFDGYFNWTWTYKLDSDARWGYIVVRDSNDNIIGPNKDMHWIKQEDMLPVTDELKATLRRKKKAAVWFVSNCVTTSEREGFAFALRRVLKVKYNLVLDVYGACGDLNCPRDEKKCDELVRTDYMFYLSLENAFSEDYVTEKLTNALLYNAVPIVYGGANYSRFLPDGSYLDGFELKPDGIAAKINESFYDSDIYLEYFKWTRHYRYERRGSSPETDDYCGFCELLNDDAKVNKTTIYKDFFRWWDSSSGNHLCTRSFEL